jgi:hypothetical protein
MEFFWFVLSVAVCGGLAWVAIRLEPHWVSKDGRNMLCAGQYIDTQGNPQGRWRETRVIIPEEGPLRIDQKRLMRRNTSYWQLEQQAPGGGRKAVFLLRGRDTDGTPAFMALRFPASSKALPVIQGRLPGAATRGPGGPTA